MFLLYSCNSGDIINAQKANFGIYETIKTKEIPTSLIDSLKIAGIQPEKDKQLPIIGYFLEKDSIRSKYLSAIENIKLVGTFYPVDKEGKYFALVAIKNNPIITISDIKKTKSKNNEVEIYFNANGAQKWV